MISKVVAIVQARMSSSRLPGKVLLDIEGEAMLGRVVTRTARAQTVQEVVVATTTDAADDAICLYCDAHRVAVSRGSQFDVLDRYYQAAAAMRADAVVRITGDCPAIDPDLIDDVVRALRGEYPTAGPGASEAGPADLDFAANRLPPPWKRTYPIGLDVEACTFGALERAWRLATEPQQREHVMPYLYEGVKLVPANPGIAIGGTARGFRVALLDCGSDLGDYRWTVDTAEDLEFIRRVFAFFQGRDDFSWRDILGLLQSHPELMKINAGVRHKALKDVDQRAGGLDLK